MKLEQLELTHFRNIPNLKLKFGSGLNLLLGANAQGKTNILEAIHLLSTARSFRSRRDQDLVSFGQNFARAKSGDVEVVLAPGEKKLRLYGKPARAAEVLGVLQSILFSPEDMSLLSGPPLGRRAWLDELISRVDRKYLLTLISYHRAVKQRNRLLWLIRERGASPQELASWNEILVRDGAALLARRQEVLAKIQEELDQLSPELLGEKLKINYVSALPLAKERSVIAQNLNRELSIRQGEEIKTATTLVGPHRDDLAATLAEKNIGRFGSRGEQRAAILALKLAEIAFAEKETGARPVLLLDDVLSELDRPHRERLLAEIKKGQTILSSTGRELIPEAALKNAKIFLVRAGEVEEEDAV
jgi:DNA replication and repair protein RecF